MLLKKIITQSGTIRMFLKLFTEMAIMKGDYDSNTFSHENDWEYDYSPDSGEENDTKLIGQNSKGYKLYKTDYIMFLTDNSNKYLGAVEYVDYGKTVHLETAHSTLKKDFYKNLFELLLKEYKEIKSDHVLSEKAFKAYSKLQGKFKVQVVDRDNNYYEFTKDNLFIDGGNAQRFNSDKHDQDEYFRTVSVKK